ncbi:MAG TPA: ABC transporter substrate-binding protein [Solirubrobacteraceae bacterium]|nr:ABC transporter substrate-binding protein [Solirubrobacteraceae bacterium]
MIAPFTGPAAEFGKLLSAPCYAATDLINKAGGVLGHPLHCTAIDDTGDAADAVPNVTRAIATIPNLDMAEGLESNTAATTVPIVNGAKIPFVTTNGLVAFSKNDYQYYWRLTPSDDANGAAFAVWAVRKGYKNVAVVFQNGIGSQGNLPGVLSAMHKLGGKLSLQMTIPADSASYQSEVAKVIADKPGALIWSADPQTTATFMSEYKQLNNGQLPAMITATDSLTPDFYNALTKVVGSNYVTHDVYLVGSSFSQTTPAFALYKGALSSDPRTHAIANVLSAVGPPASVYDGLNILALAMIEAKSTVGSVYNSYIEGIVTPKPGAVVVDSFAAGKQALAEGKKIQYVGVLGPVVFDRYHNSAGTFAANMFTTSGAAQRVGTISGSQVLGLL